ncbi:MAG: hypothetical protein JOY59_12715 [Candidatus Eremiobacteraeota bacterium]|nr:hypothetical protein [Candidatus Eremiobacteraeota bacterium]
MVLRDSRAARRTRALAALALAFVAAFALVTASAQAQGLPLLTVTALSMSADRIAPPAGATFHVQIHLHVAQRSADLNSLVLPNTTNLTILGDEKHVTPSSQGTDYVEVLSVAGIGPGDATLTPAFIDARDPSRGGRPFRFSSNALRVRITGDVAEPPWRSAGTTLVRISEALLVVLIVIVVAAGSIWLVLGMRRKRREYVLLPPARPVVPPAPPIDRTARLRMASVQLQATRTRANAAALRAALFAFANARSEETLEALLARISAGEAALRASLRAAERATFIDELHLQGAIDDLLDAMRRMGFS